LELKILVGEFCIISDVLSHLTSMVLSPEYFRDAFCIAGVPLNVPAGQLADKTIQITEMFVGKSRKSISCSKCYFLTICWLVD